MVFWPNDEHDRIYILHYPICQRTFILIAEGISHIDYILSNQDFCACPGEDLCEAVLHEMDSEDIIEDTMIIGEGKDLYELTLTAKKLEIAND